MLSIYFQLCSLFPPIDEFLWSFFVDFFFFVCFSDFLLISNNYAVIPEHIFFISTPKKNDLVKKIQILSDRFVPGCVFCTCSDSTFGHVIYFRLKKKKKFNIEQFNFLMLLLFSVLHVGDVID